MLCRVSAAIDLKAAARLVIAVSVVVCVAIPSLSCGNAQRPNPIAPGRTGSATLSGSVSWVLDGGPVAGATVSLEKATANTSADGAFTLSGLPENAIGIISVSGSHLVTRQTRVLMEQVRSGIPLNVIPADLLQFYRWFVRDGYESPFFKSISRWEDTAADPSFYINAVLVDTGEEVPADIIADIKRVFINSVPELTGGRFRVKTIEVGQAPRPTVEGWINLTFRHSFPDGRLGQAFVGANPGRIEIVHDPAADALGVGNPDGCLSRTVNTAQHEIVHAMGFYHTNQSADFRTGPGCPGTGRPETVRRAAAIAYSRPRGNVDPDLDPVGIILQQPELASTSPLLACRLSHFR